MVCCREELGTQGLVHSNAQAGASRQLKRAQAASQAAFKEVQDADAAIDAEQLTRQAILADRVCDWLAGLRQVCAVLGVVHVHAAVCMCGTMQQVCAC